MKKILFTLVALSLVAVLALGAVACQESDWAKDSELVVMAPDGAPAMAIAKLMKEDSAILAHPVDYRLIAATAVASSMTNGDADIIIAPTNAGMNLSIVTKGYQLVAVTSWGNLALVTTDETLLTLKESESAAAFMAQFAERSITSIGSNQVPDKTLKHLLGLVEVENCTVAAASEAPVIQTGLRQGDIDIALLGEPAVTATAKNVEGVRVLGFLSDVWSELVGKDFPQAGVFAKRELIANEPEAVEAFLTSLKESIAYLNASKQNAVELGTYMEQTGLSSLKGAIVGLSYQGMHQAFVSAKDAKDAVVAFITVLGVQYEEAAHADIFYQGK